ncbi:MULTISPECIES: hypothetical protein [unclassified Streptomyces]|uniref:hypothetical protein n=1 Tax=unclassified Streptomyces TaxID=2593676 RepID=UPI000DACB1D2|nr:MULTISPECIES: hypothetical protein [unclassified Streptomyces]PZT73568.1 hypothetical protein DNK55_14985 [Streptomyces sp. AC1-42T]PZT83439.1 hypothetical protein DNK56_16440 [Streptomyces sp. AC1-42W]
MTVGDEPQDAVPKGWEDRSGPEPEDAVPDGWKNRPGPEPEDAVPEGWEDRPGPQDAPPPSEPEDETAPPEPEDDEEVPPQRVALVMVHLFAAFMVCFIPRRVLRAGHCSSEPATPTAPPAVIASPAASAPATRPMPRSDLTTPVRIRGPPNCPWS